MQAKMSTIIFVKHVLSNLYKLHKEKGALQNNAMRPSTIQLSTSCGCSSQLKLKLYILRPATPTPCHCEEQSDAPQGGLSCPSGNSPPGNLRSRALRLLRIFGKYVLLCQEIATGASALAMTEERTIPGKRIGGQLRKCWCAVAGGPCRPRNDRGKSITDCAT